MNSFRIFIIFISNSQIRTRPKIKPGLNMSHLDCKFQEFYIHFSLYKLISRLKIVNFRKILVHFSFKITHLLTPVLETDPASSWTTVVCSALTIRAKYSFYFCTFYPLTITLQPGANWENRED